MPSKTAKGLLVCTIIIHKIQKKIVKIIFLGRILQNLIFWTKTDNVDNDNVDFY